MKWSLIFVSVFISLMVSDPERDFMCLLATSASSFEKYLFMCFVYVLIGLVILLLSFLDSLYIWILFLYQTQMWIYVFQCFSCLIALLNGSFSIQKLCNLVQSHLYIFSFIVYAFRIFSQEFLVYDDVLKYNLMVTKE